MFVFALCGAHTCFRIGKFWILDAASYYFDHAKRIAQVAFRTLMVIQTTLLTICFDHVVKRTTLSQTKMIASWPELERQEW